MRAVCKAVAQFLWVLLSKSDSLEKIIHAPAGDMLQECAASFKIIWLSDPRGVQTGYRF